MQQTESEKLEQIIHLSKTKSFALPTTEYLSSVQSHHHWAPESITPWFYLPVYTQMSAKLRLRYNQLYALGINEIFTLFESDFVHKILSQLRTEKQMSPLQKEALKYFCEEEVKHSEMFRRLNSAVSPKEYEKDSYRLIHRRSQFGKKILEMITKWPHFFLMWVWMAIFFEERTVMYAKEYIKDSSPLLSPVFKEVHKLHMIEEMRHIQMDELLIDLFYKKSNWFRRKIAALMFKKVIADFSAPRRMSYSIAEILRKEFQDSESQKLIQIALEQLPTLKTNTQFQEKMFGDQAAPRTRALTLQFPELAGIL